MGRKNRRKDAMQNLRAFLIYITPTEPTEAKEATEPSKPFIVNIPQLMSVHMTPKTSITPQFLPFSLLFTVAIFSLQTSVLTAEQAFNRDTDPYWSSRITKEMLIRKR